MRELLNRAIFILPRLLTGIILFSICLNSAYAWKPSSHVYLGKHALDEVDDGTTLIPFFRVDYTSQEKLELLGSYPANENLVNILRNNRDSFYAGIVGPDAFPDLPTGQTRIHIPCPDDISKVEAGHGCPTGHNHTVISDHWLQHIWSSSQEENQSEAVRAFAFGFLTHAAGDMFMHTFINHFAGGPFSSLSDNGLRHFLIESYVGKKTPELSAAEYDIVLDDTVQKFIYEKLTYAKSGSKLDRDLLIDVPLTDAEENSIFLLSVPRYFSTLKNTLDFQINVYDTTVEAHNEAINNLQAQLTDCVDRALDLDLLNDCSALEVVELSLQISNAQLVRDLYMTPRLLPIEYAREWSADIEQGLFAWPAFSHEVLRAFVFSPDGMDKIALTEAWENYRNNHFLKMLGVPDNIAENQAFIDNIKDSIYTFETRQWVEDLKLSFIDRLIRLFTLEQHTLEDLENFVKSPEANIPRFVDQPPQPIDNDNVPSIPVSITELDNIMALNGGVFDTDRFAPAHNTLTMLKLMLLSEEGIQQLYRDVKCPETQDCKVSIDSNDSNAMLGFIRTLDGGNEWHNHQDKMWFAECDVYPQLFMQQLGEVASIGENCQPPQPKLNSPEIFPGGNSFDSPVEITLQHEESNVDIYYTINTEDQLFEPSNNPLDSRSTLYIGPFTLYTPFTGAQPLTIKSRAFKNGYQASESVNETFIINSEQSAPSFFPENLDYFGNVDISMNADDGSTIFYTTNGETPTYLSTRYTQPVNFGPGEHLVKAIAYRIGYAPSTVNEFSFQVFSANDENLVATPRFNPAGSTTTVDELEVSIFVDAEDMEIYYTIADGFAPAEPTQNDNLYTDPFTLGLGNHFIKAKAFDPNNPARVSLSRQIRFTIDNAAGETDIPLFDPPPGTYFNTVKVKATAVTIPENIGTPIIGYTDNGTEPVIDIIPQFPTKKYNGNFINVFKTSVIKAQAVQKFFRPSEVIRAEYHLQVGGLNTNPPAGTYENSVEIFLESETEFPKLYYTLDGSEPTEESTEFVLRDNFPIILTESATLKVKGFKNGYFDSEVFTANYVVEQLTAPEVTKQPEDLEVFENSHVQFTVAANGNPAPTYQWFKNDELITGANQTYLLLKNVQLNESADYQVEISNEAGSLLSDKIELKVIPLPSPPLIVQQPQNANLNQGESLNLTVEVDSEAEEAYQWYFNGLLLAEQKEATLNIESLKLVHSGDYQVRISNRGGETFSEKSKISVTNPDQVVDIPPEQRPPQIINQPTDINLIAGENLQLTIAVNDILDASYLWFHNETALADQRDALLIINNVNQQHAGDYFVLVSNTNGSVVSEKAIVSIVENNEGNNNQDNTQDQNNGDQQQGQDDSNQENDVIDDKPLEDNQETENDTNSEEATINKKTSRSAIGPIQLALLIFITLLFRSRIKRKT